RCRSGRALQHARRQPERRGWPPGNDLGGDGQNQTAAKLRDPVPAQPAHGTGPVATRRFDGGGCSPRGGNFRPRIRTQAVVEVRRMITTGFGRRVPATQRPGLVLIPDSAAEFPAPVVDLASLSELKERIRTVLLSRIDPTVAG